MRRSPVAVPPEKPLRAPRSNHKPTRTSPLPFHPARSVFPFRGPLSAHTFFPRTQECGGLPHPFRGALGDPHERFGDRALDAHGYLIGSIDLGRRRIDVDDTLVMPRVPSRRRVLHQIITDADDHIGPIEPT